MNKKSAAFAVAIGLMFCVVAGFRLFNYDISGLVVALFSLTAALVSLSDLLEITKFRKFVVPVLYSALAIFIGAMVILILKLEVKFTYVTAIGDSSTLIGLGLVIIIFGLKELIEKNDNLPVEEDIKISRYKVTENEYKEMMEINDIIERLKDVDNRVLNFNKVHTGWASLSDTLVLMWNDNRGPFFDGGNREKYSTFLNELDSFAEDISNSADTNYLNTKEKPINMWGTDMPINMQRRSNGIYDLPLESILTKRQNVLNLWAEFKDLVNKRYEYERSKQK